MVFLTKLFGEKLELSLVLMLQRSVKLYDFFFSLGQKWSRSKFSIIPKIYKSS